MSSLDESALRRVFGEIDMDPVASIDYLAEFSTVLFERVIGELPYHRRLEAAKVLDAHLAVNDGRAGSDTFGAYQRRREAALAYRACLPGKLAGADAVVYLLGTWHRVEACVQASKLFGAREIIRMLVEHGLHVRDPYTRTVIADLYHELAGRDRDVIAEIGDVAARITRRGAPCPPWLLHRLCDVVRNGGEVPGRAVCDALATLPDVPPEHVDVVWALVLDGTPPQYALTAAARLRDA